ncbi:Na+/H+ antiporter, NhaC family protein [Paraglaciecola psychrophila 170]|uniref:Na+/H+ antiporter, NhaC family protein n=1 Tax=Paraglaciecola psychrophila 170 TaxID=1129794 RepID=M4RLA1_9ALTE|nr:Na+/H+ antiporter, NhaC family protein [Paraglaciecola psychrophila 170]
MKLSEHAKPGLLLALTPVVLTLLILGTQIFYFGVFEPHIPLAIGLAITSVVGIKLGLSWKGIEKGIFHVIHVALPSVSVLITVGMIIGVWIASGTVPSIIYFGLKVLSPELFLAAGMGICALVSLSLGTSWASVGTVGLALMGIGEGFDIPAYWTAGAVVSGAFFGDKISPLSDTTNLAPAVTGTDVFSHIKNMMATTIPAMLIALIIYLLVGFFVIDTQSISFEKINDITNALDENFYISGWVLLPALIVMGLAIKKISSHAITIRRRFSGRGNGNDCSRAESTINF